MDDDEVAARLVQHLEERRAGRVTFMPLNRITGRSHKVPVNVEQAIPLMKKVEFAPIYRGVMEQVFGKTLLCRDNEIAADYAAKFDVDCVTMEGFQVLPVYARVLRVCSIHSCLCASPPRRSTAAVRFEVAL